MTNAVTHDMPEEPARCPCHICARGRILREAAKKLTPEERAALDDLEAEAEVTDNELAWLQAKIIDGEPVMLACNWYKAVKIERP